MNAFYQKKTNLWNLCRNAIICQKGFEEDETSRLNWIPGEVVKLDLGSQIVDLWDGMNLKLKIILKFLEM